MQFTDAPCARGVIFLVQGETLFETLALNLARYPDPSYTPIPYQPDDCLTWEMDHPFTPDRSVPRGYLDYLTWQNRRVLLLPEATADGVVVRQVTIAPALRLESNVLDPMKHYRKEKRGPLPLTFTENRALWRDSAALFRLRDEAYQPPRAFQWLAELVDEDILSKSQTRRYLALGMASKPGQAKVNFYRSERMPLPLAYLKEKALVDALETALNMAEKARNQLWGATRRLATFILSPEADTESARQPDRKDLDSLTHQWAVERRYWAQLELPFRRTMEALPQDADEALTTWRRTLLKAAWEAFDQVADNLGHDPRTLKAVVRAREQLAASLAKTLPT